MIVYKSRILRPDRTPLTQWRTIDKDVYNRGRDLIHDTAGPTGLIYQFKAFTLIPVDVLP